MIFRAAHAGASPPTTAWALVAAAAAALVYLPGLANELVWDDRLDIVANPRVHGVRHALDYFSQPHGIYYRPLVFLTFAIDHAFWGDAAWGYHLTNLLLHALNVFLLVSAARGGGLAPRAALVAGLLFGLHPVQTDAVAYVSGRTDLLATSGGLLAWHALHAPWSTPARGIAAALGVAVAVLGKESGYALVPLVAWLAWRRGGDRRSRARLAGPALLVAGVLLILRPNPLPWPEGWPFTSVVAVARALRAYLMLLVWPADLQVDRLTASTGSAPGDAAALALAALVLAAAAWSLWQRGRTADWAAWTVAWYLPVANLVALYPAIAGRWLFTPEHNVYAPLAGLAVIAADALARLRAPATVRRVVSAGVAVLLVAGSARTVARLRDWRDEARLFAGAAALDSPSPRVWYNHGNARARAGAWSDAAAAYRAALRLAPRDVDAWTNLGVALQQQGQLDGAIAAYTTAVSLAPPSAQLLENLGTAQLRRGDVRGARASFVQSLTLDPRRETARTALTAIDSR